MGGGAGANFNPTQDFSEAADDRIQCDFCGRKFNETAANRHIPLCESKHKANLMKQGPPRAPKRGASYGGRR